MTRRLLAALIVSTFAVTALSADDNIRAVQTKLKNDGFYFGEVDGAASSDLSAAITRYQIRNGLQITGNLNAETSKALGVKAEASAQPPAAPPSSETWQKLRKTDAKFLEHRAPPSPPHQNASASNVLERSSADPSRLLLNPERLRDYVAAFVLAGLDPTVGAELDFFADRVRYYDQGMLDRAEIRADLQRYDARWPERRFWLAGDVDAAPQPDSRIRVTFPLRYELRNGSKHLSGKLRKRLLLEVRGDDLQIVAVDETKT